MASTTYQRDRTQSKYEEQNVSSFVERCVNPKCGIKFFTSDQAQGFARDQAEAYAAGSPKRIVLLLGTTEQLTDANAVASFFPYYTEEVKIAITEAIDGKVYMAQIFPHARVLVGKVPTRASRHNCSFRPDVITALVADAISHATWIKRPKPASGSTTASDDAAGGVTEVDVFSCVTEQLGVAAAVARAVPHPFSARSGRAERGYCDNGVAIRVVFAGKSEHSEASVPHNMEKLISVAHAVLLCRRLVDAPTNLLDTTTFTEIAVAYVEWLKARGLPVSVNIIAGEELREKGYGGLYGVGKAAEFPPHLVTLTYEAPAPTSRIAFVGKGIVYDTGGLAVKTVAGMKGMKGDMGGAAAVFCGFLALAQLNLPICMSATLCLADNAIGPRSQRNDDVVLLKSGLTVEINNTDAEGRIVLSDGVYHASALLDFTPDVIVDMATLTGAQGIATGKRHAAIYVNDEALETRLMKAGRDCGDLVFPVVYCPEFHNSEFSSPVADYTNSVANRGNAQVSCAAQFIGNNLSKNYTGGWAHVDIASPALQNGSATGYGVALLLQMFAGGDFSS